MNARWDGLTVADLQELERIARLTCGFEMTSTSYEYGKIEREKA